MNELQIGGGRWEADIERRLRVLETAPRVGLSRMRFARATAAVSPTTFGAWELGAGGSTWVDDSGTTGTGHPLVTVVTNTRAMVFFSAAFSNVGNDLTVRSSLVDFGVGIDGASPEATTAPLMYRRYFQPATGAAPQQVPLGFFAFRADFGAGTHTFQVAAKWQNSVPAAATQPLMSEAFVCVIPI